MSLSFLPPGASLPSSESAKKKLPLRGPLSPPSRVTAIPPGAEPPSARGPLTPPASRESAIPPGVESSSLASAKQPPKHEATERVEASYKQLSLAASNLNSASDELGKVIGVLDKAIKKLNLGLSAWVAVSGNDACAPDGCKWWSREIGYGKVEDKWGIALRESEGDHRFGDEDSSEVWLFNDAPRWMRVEAIGKIPELLERLVKQTEETTKTIKKKTEQAYELAQVIQQLSEDSQAGEQK